MRRGVDFSILYLGLCYFAYRYSFYGQHERTSDLFPGSDNQVL
jgi:hypothetical protein